MGTIWGRSGSLEFDDDAELAEGALAYFYEAGTSTPKAVYSDGDESTPHEFPVEADGGRWPAVFVPFGSYKILITTAGGTTLFSADDVPNPEPFDEDFELDETAVYNTGDYIFMGKNGTRSGAVRCNGRTIGDASSSATERANADTEDLFAYLWDNYADGQAAVSGGRGGSAAADFAAHKRIALPDHRSAHVVGFDDMGNSAASLMGSAPVVSGSAILAGSIIGANTHTLTEAQLAAHTHTFSVTSGAGSSHTHTFSDISSTESADHGHVGTTDSGGVDHTHSESTNNAVASGGVNISGGNWGLVATTTGGASAYLHTHTITTGGASATHTHDVSGTTSGESSHTHSVSGTSASTGGGTAHNIVSRAIPVTVLMKL